MSDHHKPGVYFKLPWADYLGDPSLGSSAIKDLLISPEAYWYNHRDPERKRQETAAKSRGSAYHTHVLEGPDQFASEFAQKPNPADYPDAAVTADDLKQACEEIGISAKRTKKDTIAELRDWGWEGDAWDEIKARLDEKNDGKTLLSSEDIAKIVRLDKIVRNNEHISAALADGWPEVSIFVEYNDVPLRARVDWLGPKWHVSLKTFSNPNRTPLDKHLANRVAYEKYFVELVMYAQVIEAAKQLPDDAFHDAPEGFVEAFKASEPHQSLFIFLGTDTPCVRARGLVPKGQRSGVGGRDASAWTWDAGDAQFKEALKIYRAYRDRFDADAAWAADEPIRYFADTEFPAFIME